MSWACLVAQGYAVRRGSKFPRGHLGSARHPWGLENHAIAVPQREDKSHSLLRISPCRFRQQQVWPASVRGGRPAACFSFVWSLCTLWPHLSSGRTAVLGLGSQLEPGRTLRGLSPGSVCCLFGTGGFNSLWSLHSYLL